MDAITTWLELAGALLIVAAAALTVAYWSIPGALACAGVLMIGLSGLLVRRARPTREGSE